MGVPHPGQGLGKLTNLEDKVLGQQGQQTYQTGAPENFEPQGEKFQACTWPLEIKRTGGHGKRNRL